MNYTICAEHTSGGDGKLPVEDRGFFDGWEFEIKATSVKSAEVAAWIEIYEIADKRGWMSAAIDGLVLKTSAS